MTTYNRFQGEPAVTLKNGGASMQYISGQPVMDQGLENTTQISLFTKPGWWGNVLFSDPNKKIGSTFQEIRPIIDIQTINDYTDAADDALSWMKKVKLASKIDIEVTNPYNDQIRTKIIITPPGQNINELLFTSNGLNWIAQANNPAHARFNDAL